MGNGLKLGLMLLLAFLAVSVWQTGLLGSMLGAIFTPDYMQVTTPGG